MSLYFNVLESRMRFWPRFAISRNDVRNWVKVKDMFTLRPAPSTTNRGGSCCDSQIGCRRNISKVLRECVIMHSKTPIGVHVTVLVWGYGCGAGTGKGRGQVRMRLGDWEIGNVCKESGK